MPVMVLLTLAGKEKISTLTNSISLLPAYEGDAIFVGQSWTGMSAEWTVQQQPLYGDGYKTLSFFVVSESEARENVFPFRARFKSKSSVVLQNTNSIGFKRYIYLLPKSRLPKGKEAKIKYKFNITSMSSFESLNGILYVFKNRQSLSNFQHFEPGSQSNCIKCMCVQSEGSGMLGCPRACATKPNFSPQVDVEDESSYYFFAANAMSETRVQYSVKMTMYFYNITSPSISKGYRCTISGRDTCKFLVNGYTPSPFPFWPWPEERDVVLAYIHPSNLSHPPTTHISITKDGNIWCATTWYLCIASVTFLAIRFVWMLLSKLWNKKEK